MWFEALTGFVEESPAQVRANMVVEGNKLTSIVNGKTWNYGHLETPTLAELRARTAALPADTGQLSVREVVGNVKHFHQDAANAGAFFQVASQFNLLEMASPSATPEKGVGIYENDPTQGPACAVAAGAGTIYRNYFAEVNGRTGQSTDNQIDCLADMGKALGNSNERLWKMQNGYALASREGLMEISAHINAMTEDERDALRQTLRIGLQWDTQVTLADCSHLVSQAYCSALPVAYGRHPRELWATFAQLVLEAAYEATLCAAHLNFAHTGNPTLFLTLLGGGVFGNHEAWIFAAMRRAVRLFAHTPLDVAIVSYGNSKPSVRDFLTSL